MTTEQRLWGTPGAEHMEFDAESAYESQIDGMFLGAEDELLAQTDTLEEWSVSEDKGFPSALSLREYLAEHIAENAADGTGGEDYYEAVYDAVNCVEVEQLLAPILETIRGRITYLCADTLIASHTLTYACNNGGGIDVFMDDQLFYDHPPASKATP